MKRLALLVMMLGACSQPSKFAFQNVSVTLPDETTTLPPGPNVEVVTQNCTACHSPSMILTQPRLTRVAWEGEVAKMIKAYKAPVEASAVTAIVDYLVATNERLTSVARSARSRPSAP